MIKPMLYSIILVLLSSTFLQASPTRQLTLDTVTQQNNNDDIATHVSIIRSLYASVQPAYYLDNELWVMATQSTNPETTQTASEFTQAIMPRNND